MVHQAADPHNWIKGHCSRGQCPLLCCDSTSSFRRRSWRSRWRRFRRAERPAAFVKAPGAHSWNLRIDFGKGAERSVAAGRPRWP